MKQAQQEFLARIASSDLLTMTVDNVVTTARGFAFLWNGATDVHCVVEVDGGVLEYDHLGPHDDPVGVPDYTYPSIRGLVEALENTTRQDLTT